MIGIEGLPEIKPGDDLAELLDNAVEFEDGDIVVVAQKAVSKAEGRVVSLDGIAPSARAGKLSGGEQQMLAVGRALMTDPKLLLLDEPSTGLAPMIVQEFFRLVKTYNEEQGLTVLVVEQNASIALEISNRAYVLEVGHVALSGPSDELRQHEGVRASYLGY